MTLHPPFSISSRLLPALEVGGATISLDRTNFIFDLPGGQEHTVTDYRPGMNSRGLHTWFADILGFLGSAIESRQHRERNNETEIDPDGQEGLFPPHVLDWACQYSDDIAILGIGIEESPKKLIVD